MSADVKANIKQQEIGSGGLSLKCLWVTCKTWNTI